MNFVLFLVDGLHQQSLFLLSCEFTVSTTLLKSLFIKNVHDCLLYMYKYLCILSNGYGPFDNFITMDKIESIRIFFSKAILVLKAWKQRN